MGDAAHDDTDAFERALDALPRGGGTLIVPRGIYLIDPRRSINLRDGVTLALHPQGVLEAIPVADWGYAIVKAAGARNVRIVGGSIIGERARHLGTGGESGMGIWIAGCTDVVIEDVHTGDCWGDGIYIGSLRAGTHAESRKVTIRRCRSVNNRRQGLSITGCIGAVITDSEFSGTNGTAPQSGIDLEPADALDIVRDVRIARCRAVRNAGDGIMLVDTVRDVILEHNVMSQNGREGLFVRESTDFLVNENTITSNRANGIKLEAAYHCEITANVIASNGSADPAWFDNISIHAGSSENLIADNDFRAATPGVTTGPHLDIRIAAEECLRNRLLRNLLRDGGPGARILDNGSLTEIVAPKGDRAPRRRGARYTPVAVRRVKRSTAQPQR